MNDKSFAKPEQILAEMVYIAGAKIGAISHLFRNDGERSKEIRLGNLRRDDEGFFVEVEDTVGNETYRVSIPEDNLRNKGLSNLVQNANCEYNSLVEERGRERKKLRRRKRNIAFSALLSVAALIGANEGRKFYYSPERVAARQRDSELDDAAVSIAKRFPIEIRSEWTFSDEKETYLLNDGTKVSTGVARKTYGKDSDSISSVRLYIEESDPNSTNNIYVSEYYVFPGTASDDAKNLEYVLSRQPDGKLVTVADGKNKISSEQRATYERLIKEIAKLNAANK